MYYIYLSLSLSYTHTRMYRGVGARIRNGENHGRGQSRYCERVHREQVPVRCVQGWMVQVPGGEADAHHGRACRRRWAAWHCEGILGRVPVRRVQVRQDGATRDESCWRCMIRVGAGRMACWPMMWCNGGTMPSVFVKRQLTAMRPSFTLRQTRSGCAYAVLGQRSTWLRRFARSALRSDGVHSESPGAGSHARSCIYGGNQRWRHAGAC